VGNDVVAGISARQTFAAIPRVSAAQWDASSLWVRWLIASRAAVLVMTLFSAAVGGVLALMVDRFDAAAWLLALVGLLLAHAANNQLNDLTDSMRGIDAGNSCELRKCMTPDGHPRLLPDCSVAGANVMHLRNSQYFRNQYGAHVLADGLLTRRELSLSFAVTGAAALAIGIALVIHVGAAVVWPLTAGAFCLLFYTYPLKQLGLGELAVWLVWGPLMTGGSYLIASGAWSWDVAVIGAVYALGPTMVIFGKHIDKFAFDSAKGVRTLPVRLGVVRARRSVIAMVWIQYACFVSLVVAGLLPWTVLLVALALPQARRLVTVYREAAPAGCPPDYRADVWPLWYAAFAFAFMRRSGLLFFVGLLGAWGIDRFV
jgi:1,4-dihydroxy-2-naphthoate polyprenyltransferase